MSPRVKKGENRLESRKTSASIGVYLWIFFALFLTGCGGIKSPTPEPFIGENKPSPKQEFRWSNGKMPKSFDPALASAAPETDFVRALYEGLTDVDAKTLKPIPAVATKWTVSEDFKTWTFQLRRDAKWTNGEAVKAQNFVDSWKRLAELGDKVPQQSLLKNIVGMNSEVMMPVFAEEPSEETGKEENNNYLQQHLRQEANLSVGNKAAPQPNKTVKDKPVPPKQAKFGIEAVSDYTLKIDLIHPDQDFPLLVAHPLFRPVYGDGKYFETDNLKADIVTNGAFKVTSVSKDGITLERSPVYWNKYAVKLETVKFIPTDNAESALNAYREGKVDAVTNANFRPLALKLLQPFKDEFQQTPHGALNFYEFNLQQKPFDDSRIRKALAISIDREELTEDELDGATAPALKFLPFEKDNGEKLEQSVEKARKLLAQAGYPNGENFPVIKLLINRNNVQQKIARSVARMWERNLNIKTEIVIKEQADIQNMVETGDFSLVRRGVVLPTNNETSNMLAIFDESKMLHSVEEVKENPEALEMVTPNQILNEKTAETELNFGETENTSETTETPAEEQEPKIKPQTILTENQALEQLPAIPLYFPTSYSLVKPYIKGFEMNAFDATSLKTVEIDNNWQPADQENNSNK